MPVLSDVTGRKSALMTSRVHPDPLPAAVGVRGCQPPKGPMTLRTRLTLAFFAISVVPLAAVTLFSYASSERALRRAAEQQADELAVDLGRRMELVTADLERRMQRAWPPPPPQTQTSETQQARNGPQRPAHPAPPTPPAAVSPEQVAGHVAGVLGDIASVFDAVEFVAPPTGTRDSGPRVGGFGPRGDGPGPRGDVLGPRGAGPGPRGGGPPSGAPIMDPRAAAEVSQALQAVVKKYQTGRTAEGQADLAAWTANLQEQIRQGLSQYSRPKPQGAGGAVATGPNGASASPDESQRSVTVLRGNALHTEVRQDGQQVGEINARINPERLFRAVFSMSRRGDRKEIPFAVDAEGQLHAPRSSDQDLVKSLKLTVGLPESGTNIRSINDWVVATRKDPSGATFGIARPLGDDLRDLRRVSISNFGMGFGLIALVFVASIPLAGGMTKNLRRLMDGVTRVSGGDLSARVALKSNDEFGRLGAAFNKMAENLAAHEKLVIQQGRIKRELELCRLIQTEMLPRQPLRLGLTEVKGVSIPAREVGGDFFNYFALPDGEIALLVGDVSGKGVGAALLMANVQATLRARLPLERDLARLADALDIDLEQNTPPEVYLTLWVGIVDTKRRELRYVNAGHNTQFVLRSAGGFEKMSSTGRPLGLLAGAGYEEVRLDLHEGDILFFYTDGMVEAENERGEFLGHEKLEAALASSPRTDVDSVLVHVESVVREFRGAAELSDDATMMALRFRENELAAVLV
jgi:serine phosphatase RsbU (regulator of sigma subunit)